MKLTAMPVLDVADLDHEVNQVLDGEQAVEVDGILLVDILDEVPELVDHLDRVGVYPEVAGHHQTLEERFLQPLLVSDQEPDVCQVLDGLLID